MFAVIKHSPDQQIFHYRSLLLNIHWDEWTSEHLSTISDACAKLVKEWGQMCSIVIMRGDINVDLSSETRRVGAELTSKFEHYNRGQAIVVEADGFRASMVRSVITGINLVARSRAKQRVFKDPEEATYWLCTLDTQPAEIRDTHAQTWAEIDKLLREVRA